VPIRTCTGCRKTAPQRELVRLVFDGARLVIDPGSRPASGAGDLGSEAGGQVAGARPVRRPGRGAYVHANPSCVTAAGLSRSFRRPIGPADVAGIVADMSPSHDNRGDQPLQNAGQNAPGLAGGDTVEMPPRIKAKQKDDRSEDARL
jgi:predicted RNA-binding protein YlxR (DUF448 family)